MSERGHQLLGTADAQISELIGLLSQRGEAALRVPCPGREKLGDGTVAALASHTADSYLRIAGFLQAESGHHEGSRGGHDEGSRGGHDEGSRGRHDEGSRGGHDEGTHKGHHTTDNVDLRGLLERLSAGQAALNILTGLTDEQLDGVPASGSFRFCDGQRTVEQVVAGLLNHQRHQVDAIKAAVYGMTS